MSFELLALLLVVGFGVPAVISDLRTQTVSNPLTLGFSAAALLFVLGRSLLFGVDPVPALLVGLLASAIFLLLYFLGRGGLGEADVKLAPGFGLLIGALSLQVFMGWLLLCFLTGGLFAAFVLMTKRMGRKQSFAFAPFMFGAALMVLAVQQ